MISLEALTAFLAVSILLVVVPGPAVLYITTRSATQGRRAGLASVAGIVTGGLVHVIAATLGLSLVLARSAMAMELIRIGGGLYLVYLGIQRFREAGREWTPDPQQKRASLGRIYRDGIIVNLLNPKTALFFLSFLPQFVDLGRGPATPQILTLGLTFLVVACLSDAMYALGASAAASALRKRSRLSARAGSYFSGAVFIGLGAFALMGGRKGS